jgi:hypothetical protein
MKLRQVVLVLSLPVASFSLAVGGGLLALSMPAAHVAGYCLACLIPFLLVAAQRREATRMQAREGLVRAGHERWFAATILLVGFIIAGIHAWYFAWGVS